MYLISKSNIETFMIISILVYSIFIFPVEDLQIMKMDNFIN